MLAADPRRDIDNESPEDPRRETRWLGSLQDDNVVVVYVEARRTAIWGWRGSCGSASEVDDRRLVLRCRLSLFPLLLSLDMVVKN